MAPKQASLRAAATFNPQIGVTYTLRKKVQIVQRLTLPFVRMSLLGHGVGSVASIGARERIGDLAYSLTSPESGYGETLVESGILGLGAYLWVMIQATLLAYKGMRKAGDPQMKALFTAIWLCTLLSIYGESLCEFVYSVGVLYWYLLGLLVALLRNVEGSEVSQEPPAKEGMVQSARLSA